MRRAPWAAPGRTSRVLRTLPSRSCRRSPRLRSFPPCEAGCPSEAAQVPGSAPARVNPVATPGLDGLWLNVQVGGSKGRSVAVLGSRFLIGRDGCCQLRLASPMVSKLHAAIERRVGIVLQDLGSTNGTHRKRTGSQEPRESTQRGRSDPDRTDRGHGQCRAAARSRQERSTKWSPAGSTAKDRPSALSRMTRRRPRCSPPAMRRFPSRNDASKTKSSRTSW